MTKLAFECDLSVMQVLEDFPFLDSYILYKEGGDAYKVDGKLVIGWSIDSLFTMVDVYEAIKDDYKIVRYSIDTGKLETL